MPKPCSALWNARVLAEIDRQFSALSPAQQTAVICYAQGLRDGIRLSRGQEAPTCRIAMVPPCREEPKGS